MRKSFKIAAVAGACLILATGVTSNVLAYRSFDKLDKYIKQCEAEKQKELEASEDKENVLIAGMYQIVSTKQISDAYINGETDKLSDKDKETLEEAEAVIKEVVTDDMTKFEKASAIYEWIVTNVKHDGEGTSAVNNSPEDVAYPLGVLKYKEAVCAGYATTFRLLTNMVGIDCMVMHEPELGHSWDICQLDDGCWYITDCYFDAGGAKFASFAMNESQAAASHSWEPDLYPQANGETYCYGFNKATEVKDAESVIETLKEPYGKDEYFYYSFKVKTSDKKNCAIVQYILDAIQTRSWSNEGSSIDINNFQVGDYTVYTCIKYLYGESNDPGKDDDLGIDYDKLEKLIIKAFGEAETYDDDEIGENGWADEENEKVYNPAEPVG